MEVSLNSKLLLVLTAIFFVTLLAFVAREALFEIDAAVTKGEGQGVGRNERSTPRSFILPATPAVAFEQEEQAKQLSSDIDPLACLRALRAMGYLAAETPPIFTAQNVEAIVRFQRANDLRATGQFNPETTRLLRC